RPANAAPCFIMLLLEPARGLDGDSAARAFAPVLINTTSAPSALVADSRLRTGESGQAAERRHMEERRYPGRGPTRLNAGPERGPRSRRRGRLRRRSPGWLRGATTRGRAPPERRAETRPG